jgi:hypothetical protein
MKKAHSAMLGLGLRGGETRVTKLPCICQGAQVFRNSPNKYPNGIYRALKNTEWNGLERIRIGHATDVLVLILPFRDVDFGASPNYPPEDSKIANIQTWQGKHFPRRLLAPQAINSKILAPGGDQGRRPYWESKTFEQSPSPYSGAHSLSHIPVQATFPPDLTQKHYLTTHTILSCNTPHTTPANRLPKPTRIHQDIHSATKEFTPAAGNCTVFTGKCGNHPPREKNLPNCTLTMSADIHIIPVYPVTIAPTL